MNPNWLVSLWAIEGAVIMANRLQLDWAFYLFREHVELVDRLTFHEFRPIEHVAFVVRHLLDPFAHVKAATQLIRCFVDRSPYHWIIHKLMENEIVHEKSGFVKMKSTHHLDLFSTFLIPFTSLRSLSKMKVVIQRYQLSFFPLFKMANTNLQYFHVQSLCLHVFYWWFELLSVACFRMLAKFLSLLDSLWLHSKHPLVIAKTALNSQLI